jgi:beta-glucosidase
MGLSPRWEGEEMNVKVAGFAGGDRTSLDLPAPQEDLIKKIAALGKPIVLVLVNGSAVSINWEKDNIPAIVESWYGGQAAGIALADVLFGDYNPSGRLPVTFYKSVSQLPDFHDYNMKGRTYRYFSGEVLFPFGYGLCYSSFSFDNLKAEGSVKENQSAKVKVDVKNTSAKEGEEVVELYVKGKGANGNDAIKSLRGFEKVSLKPGETKTVEFTVSPATLTFYKEGSGYTCEKGEHTVMVGSSSSDKDLKEIKVNVE